MKRERVNPGHITSDPSERLGSNLILALAAAPMGRSGCHPYGGVGPEGGGDGLAMIHFSALDALRCPCVTWQSMRRVQLAGH